MLAILYPVELVLYMRETREQGLAVMTVGTQGVSLEDTEKKLGVRDGTRNLFVFYPLAATRAVQRSILEGAQGSESQAPHTAEMLGA